MGDYMWYLFSRSQERMVEPITACGNGIRPDHVRYKQRFIEEYMSDQVFRRRWSVWIAESLLEKFPELNKKWSYDYGVVCKGLEMVYSLTGDERYLNYIRRCMDHFLTEDGIRYYDADSCNLDNLNNGKTLLFLYDQTGEEKYADGAKLLARQFSIQPRTSQGGFWHKKIYPYQMWLDGLYMGQPFYAEMISRFGIKDSFEDVLLQFDLIEEHLRDETTGLLYHGFDERRQMYWADRETGRSANFWSRSIGWYACALVDTLDFVTDEEGRKRLIGYVQRLADALLRFRSREKGVWFQVVDMEGRYGNYAEASGSAMYTYFLLKAIRKGYISADHFSEAKSAFYALVREFIEIDSQGLPDLHGTVYGAGLGGDTLRDGSYEYYVSEPRQKNHLHGIGAFMMAASELEMHGLNLRSSDHEDC